MVNSLVEFQKALMLTLLLKLALSRAKFRFEFFCKQFPYVSYCANWQKLFFSFAGKVKPFLTHIEQSWARAREKHLFFGSFFYIKYLLSKYSGQNTTQKRSKGGSLPFELPFKAKIVNALLLILYMDQQRAFIITGMCFT